MSVTFSVESPIIGWVAACACDKVRNTTMHETYAATYAAIDSKVETPPQCQSCAEYGEGPYARAVTLFDEAPQVDLTGANAGNLLRIIGLYEEGGDMVGSLSGAEFAGRVAQARVRERMDAGVPAKQTGVMIDCGRTPGYVQERLDQLQAVGNFAWDKGVSVTWG